MNSRFAGAGLGGGRRRRSGDLVVALRGRDAHEHPAPRGPRGPATFGAASLAPAGGPALPGHHPLGRGGRRPVGGGRVGGGSAGLARLALGTVARRRRRRGLPASRDGLDLWPPLLQSTRQVPRSWAYDYPRWATALLFGLGLGSGLYTRVIVPTFYLLFAWPFLGDGFLLARRAVGRLRTGPFRPRLVAGVDRPPGRSVPGRESIDLRPVESFALDVPGQRRAVGRRGGLAHGGGDLPMRIAALIHRRAGTGKEAFLAWIDPFAGRVEYVLPVPESPNLGIFPRQDCA